MSQQKLIYAKTDTELAKEISSVLADLDGTKIFLVSDGPFSQPVIEGLQDLGIEVELFDGFTANPLYEDVVSGLEAFKVSEADLLVSVGGGSAIDTAKCIHLFAACEPTGLEGTYINAEAGEPGIPHLAVPTTAGTGSEATTFAVVYYKGAKYSIDYPEALPQYVAMAPYFLHGLPDYHKRATCLDALCQAIESYWSVNSTEESKNYARKAIPLFLDSYKTYVSSQDDAAADAMLEAAYKAGQAINISKTTAAHAMCYQLTSLYGLAHGHAAALCLPKVWRYMIEHLEKCIDKRGIDYLKQVFADLDEMLGFDSHIESIEWFEGLLEEMGMFPPAEGVQPSDITALKGSVNAQRLGNNPVGLDEEVIAQLYLEIVPALKQVT